MAFSQEMKASRRFDGEIQLVPQGLRHLLDGAVRGTSSGVSAEHARSVMVNLTPNR